MYQNKFVILTPCYNEKKNIPKFLAELNKYLKTKEYLYDVCFIDDGSSDTTWTEIKKLKKRNKNVKGIKLTKNFGKENAIEAGLKFLKNYNYYIILDCDLQHPVRKIPEMISIFKSKNFDIISTSRIDNNEGLIREIFSTFFYKILSKFSEIKVISKSTDFMLISEEVRNEYVKIKEANKTFRILVNWMGFKRKNLHIKINKRKSGISKFNFFSLTRLALNTIAAFSIFPIKLVGYLGIIMTMLSSFTLLFILLNLFFNFTVISWQTIIVIVLTLLSGLIMISLGIIGIYLYKILGNTNTRPNFIISEKIK